jgi:transposase InsO family protein
MTKVMVEGFGWVYVVVVLDWYTKKIVRYYAGLQCAARLGIRGQGLALMSDNGCQPTAVVFMRACATLEIHQAFTRDNNPKGNADTERFIRTLKEECLWLQEWTCPFELITALEAWMITYNEQSLHAALGYKTPKQFEQDHNTSPSPPFLAA